MVIKKKKRSLSEVTVARDIIYANFRSPIINSGLKTGLDSAESVKGAFEQKQFPDEIESKVAVEVERCLWIILMALLLN